MVERRHRQRKLWEGWFPEEAAAWWEPWMKHADQVLDDAELLDAVYEAQGQRRPNSRRIVRLFQPTTSGSVSGCLARRFRKLCANSSRSSAAKSLANSIWPPAAGRTASCVRAVGTRAPNGKKTPGLVAVLHCLLEHDTAGDPITGLRWSRRTTTTITEELAKLGLAVSPNTVARLLHQMGYSLRLNHKQISTSSSPHRNLQFEYLADLRDRFQRRHLPIVSGDSKKRELVGNFKNPGGRWERAHVTSMITTFAPTPSESPFLTAFTM